MKLNALFGDFHFFFFTSPYLKLSLLLHSEPNKRLLSQPANLALYSQWIALQAIGREFD